MAKVVEPRSGQSVLSIEYSSIPPSCFMAHVRHELHGRSSGCRICARPPCRRRNRRPTPSSTNACLRSNNKDVADYQRSNRYTNCLIVLRVPTMTSVPTSSAAASHHGRQTAAGSGFQHAPAPRYRSTALATLTSATLTPSHDPLPHHLDLQSGSRYTQVAATFRSP